MAGNKIYVQGSYIDVHDNENVYLNVDKAEVNIKAPSNLPLEGEASEIPAVLATEMGMRLLDAARKAGWLDEQYHPLISRTMSAVLADYLSALLGIQNKWKVFEAFWQRKNMRGDYNDALDQKQYGKFYEKMKQNICL